MPRSPPRSAHRSVDNARRMKTLIAAALLLSLTATTAAAAELSAQDLDKRRKQLRDLLAEQWEWSLRTSPEFASILGDKRYNDQVSDNSEEGLRKEYQASKKFLARFRAIETIGFSEQ